MDFRLVTIYYFVFSSTWASKLSHISFDPGVIIIDLHKVETCNVSWNRVKILSFKSNIINNYVRSWDATVTSSIPIKKITNTVLSSTLCRGGVSYNTCEHFGTYRFGDNFCDMLNDQKAMWTPMIKATTPELRCPIKANTVYTLKNGTIDMKLLKALHLPLQDTTWKTELTADNEEGKRWGCAKFDGKLSNFIRRH